MKTNLRVFGYLKQQGSLLLAAFVVSVPLAIIVDGGVQKLATALFPPLVLVVWWGGVIVGHLAFGPAEIYKRQEATIERLRESIGIVNADFRCHSWPMDAHRNLLVVEVANDGPEASFSVRGKILAFRHPHGANPDDFIGHPFSLPTRRLKSDSHQIKRRRVGEFLLAKIHAVNGDTGEVDIWRYEEDAHNYLRDAWLNGPLGAKPEWDIELSLTNDDEPAHQPVVKTFAISIEPGPRYQFQAESL